jgi:HSP20 family protein
VTTPETGQLVPVRVYQTAERVVVMAPMPGLGPEDVDGRHVVIHGDARGPHQDDVNLSIAEWAVGPYHRELDLPEGVDGVVTNATYGNGVLVLSMPKLRAGHAGTAAEFRLVTVANAHGERVGHIGRAAIPHTTEQHRTEKDQGRQTRA